MGKNLDMSANLKKSAWMEFFVIKEDIW